MPKDTTRILCSRASPMKRPICPEDCLRRWYYITRGTSPRAELGRSGIVVTHRNARSGPVTTPSSRIACALDAIGDRFEVRGILEVGLAESGEHLPPGITAIASSEASAR